MPLESGPDRVAQGVARMVGAIVAYSRWPESGPVLDICLAGRATYAARLKDMVLSNGVLARVTDLAGGVIPATGGCDLLYIGAMDPAALRLLLASAYSRPVLTMAEDDPDCRGGTMVCLLFQPGTLSFRLNIDAVSRSTVRIDPRVLRLSKGGY